MGAAAILSVVPGLGMSAGRGIALLADVPDRQRGDGRPQRVVRREDAVIPAPVPPRLRDEIGEPIQDHPPVRDEERPLGPLRTALGVASFVSPLVTFMPEPLAVG
jgi:hypothetical protein